ncbi:phosphoribosylanthranilate isomerase [Campylobacter blaseri]|uniref:N-(5'-phosphoribosyl)anthranilate isomerase n=1 Tax=Campylobacter blaseri TaxID=2042961 RepID=A0A2P8R2E0_9BACT|nr:phosphoribosylanthranilate isomerase [Campylobacter blaseri]PSM52663.1 N-(5'-phosphoribosyl)anthranilate isomerase [Campylobacter blaseri]PSM54311.1 N-(5'-phosphoribosyl)anthranilate isomerase [Campylobacter blaseri]QKF85964.1 phosphoribosylanthranilate isomerase [Campylobacter blaseri]
MSVKVKICGIKNEIEALSVAELKVDFLGVIFAQSIRQVTPKIAKNISKIAYENGKKTVGVFAGISEDDIIKICKFSNLQIVQIYEKIEANFKDRLSKEDIEVWQVVSIKDEIPNLENLYFDKILFDYKGKKLGGNGVSFDWNLLKNFKEKPFVLAGGIDIYNAKEAVRFNPYAIDVNSKVEDSSGLKDVNLIKKLLANIKM